MLKQVHGKRVMRVDHEIKKTEEADGMITDVPGLLLCVRWADCQNFVVYEPKKKVVGVMHVGWRGLIKGIIPEFFAVLKHEWNIDASDTFVGAGASLCQKCADFSDPASELPSIDPKYIKNRTVDLQRIAIDQLLSLGVKPDHFERTSDCTRCMPETYWTYRGGHREEVKNGYTNVLAAMVREDRR